MREERRYWFPAKAYGWGWGLPVTWQGWAALILVVCLVVVGAFTVLPRYGVLAFNAFAAVLVIGFVALCWLKGEPPRWRWGKK